MVLPTKQLVGLCEVPDRLILKRNDKLLDYDNAQYKLDRNRDPTRTRIVSDWAYNQSSTCVVFTTAGHACLTGIHLYHLNMLRLHAPKCSPPCVEE